ncbi:hypothetical protein ACFQ38_01660 [Sporosarcina contaminans]|uniref:Uncharacterized protein n=1 Tax=Sporosarcina contaminans TaxID=633403 RepID=A0ABW3TTZ0_9BACL
MLKRKNSYNSKAGVWKELVLKIRNLHKEIMCNKVKELLKDRKFESLTTDLLSEAGFENVNNMNPYIPVLYSISEDIDIEMLQQIINRNN